VRVGEHATSFSVRSLLNYTTVHRQPPNFKTIISSYRLAWSRTLVFHSNNAGSNPASLIHMSIFLSKQLVNPLPNNYKLNSIRYTLRFASIITPATLANIRLLQTSSHDKVGSHNKVLVKQSYLLLTWLIYVQGAYSPAETSHVPSFFVQPVSQSKLTNLKTPMAHKTFSQEQFLFKKYILTVSFSHLNSPAHKINTINTSMFAALIMRAETPFFNTNLLFLKKFTLQLKSSDAKFFTLS
jgi:hypothetical protein